MPKQQADAQQRTSKAVKPRPRKTETPRQGGLTIIEPKQKSKSETSLEDEHVS